MTISDLLNIHQLSVWFVKIFLLEIKKIILIDFSNILIFFCTQQFKYVCTKIRIQLYSKRFNRIPNRWWNELWWISNTRIHQNIVWHVPLPIHTNWDMAIGWKQNLSSQNIQSESELVFNTQFTRKSWFTACLLLIQAGKLTQITRNFIITIGFLILRIELNWIFSDIFLEKHWRSVVSRSVCDYFLDAQRASPNVCIKQN